MRILPTRSVGAGLVALVMITGAPGTLAAQQPTQRELVDRLLEAEDPQPAPAADPEEQQKILYSLGFNLWRPVLQLALTPAEVEAVMRGLRDASGGSEPSVAMETYGPMIEAFARGRLDDLLTAEKGRARTFLERMAAEPGATPMPSGMLYFELEAGTGVQATADSTVRVDYRGTLADGTEFDSSYARGEPAEFGLASVIPCWTEGVARMKVGGKARLVCPSAIAYGDRGQPPDIPGGAVLVFEVELLEVLP